jgi:hypothetical protein
VNVKVEGTIARASVDRPPPVPVPVKHQHKQQQFTYYKTDSSWEDVYRKIVLFMHLAIR